MASSLEHVRALVSGPRSLGCDAEVEAEFCTLLKQAAVVVSTLDRRRELNRSGEGSINSDERVRTVQHAISSITLAAASEDESIPQILSLTALRQQSSAPHAVLTSSSGQVDATTGSGSHIPFCEEDGVVTLLPRTAEECRDVPRLMARAAELGASYSGVFKFMMADDVDMKIKAVRVRQVSTFQAAMKPDGTYHILRRMWDEEMNVEWCPTLEKTAEELASALEETIDDQAKLEHMRYCTDESARTRAERQQLGLSAESPLNGLKDNQLEQTKYHVPGLHSPYLYVSNNAGGVFPLHAEDGNLHSLNVSYWGALRVWITIIPQHRAKVEQRIRGWKCAQRVRHASLFVPRLLLDKWGVSYNVFVQRPRETVVVSGHTLHEGGVLSCSVAEAVNYGPPGWDISGYAECSSGRIPCPGFPIPNDFLAFLAPGESQHDQKVSDKVEQNLCGEVQARIATPDENGDVSLLGDGRDPVEQSPPGLQRQHLRRRTADGQAKSRRVESSGLCTPARTLKRQANTSLPRHRSKAFRSAPYGSRAMVALEQSIKRIDKHCQIPTYDPHNPPSAKVVQLAAAIQSRPMIQQFCAIVRSRRQAGLHESAVFLKGNDHQKLIVHAMSIATAKDRSMFEKLSTRLHQCRLAQGLEVARGTRQRNETKTLDAICKSCGWTRDNLEYHRKRGLKWTKVCGPYPGLLSFIPLGLNAFGISPDAYLDLEETELRVFHLLLQNPYSQALCSAGKAFEESLRRDVDDVSFQWEEEEVSMGDLPEAIMLSRLQPFPSGYTDLYDPIADWPAPTDWPTDWAWPADPTTVMSDSGQRCDFCEEPFCDCFRTIFANEGKVKPRIRDYGEKGRGLQAVADIPGQTAYKTRQIIGRLTGKVVPADMHNDGWTIELTRPDLPQAEPVCHLSCLTYGSNLRLLNHSCRPSATFQVFRISGRFGFAVVALRDIHHGEEMTVSYGRDYFKQRGLLCLCESCQAGEPVTSLRVGQRSDLP